MWSNGTARIAAGRSYSALLRYPGVETPMKGAMLPVKGAMLPVKGTMPRLGVSGGTGEVPRRAATAHEGHRVPIKGTLSP